MGLIPMGCAGGIAAAFNTPLAAIVLAIEEIMGDLTHRAFAGIVMVAVIAAVIERSVLGTNSMFKVPSHPDSHSLLTLGCSLVLGAAGGVLAGFFSGGLVAARERAKNVYGRVGCVVPGLGGVAAAWLCAGSYGDHL